MRHHHERRSARRRWDHEGLRQPCRRRQGLVRGAARRRLRDPRPERRGQDDDLADDQRHHRARLGKDHDPRLDVAGQRRGAQDRLPARGARPVSEDEGRRDHRVHGRAARPEPQGVPQPRREVARAPRPRQVDRQQGPGPVEGHAAEGAVRSGAAPRARDPDPRRAVERPRSDQRRRAARDGVRDPRRGPHGAVLDAPDGAGGEGGRFAVHHRARQEDPRWQPARDQAELAERRMDRAALRGGGEGGRGEAARRSRARRGATRGPG